MAKQGSDHLPCSVKLRAQKEKQLKQRNKKPFRYSRDSGSDVLQRLRNQAWSIKTVRTRFEQPPYWNPDLENMWLQKRRSTKAWQKARKRPDLSNDAIGQLKEQMNKDAQFFKDKANEAKQAKWEEFTREVAADKALHKFWKLHKKMNGTRADRTTTAIKDESGTSLETDEEKGKAYLTRYIQQTHQTNRQERIDTLEIMQHAVPRNLEYGDPVTEEVVKGTISRAKDSAAGPDGLRYKHLKGASESDLKEIVKNFNASLATGEIPDQWLHSYLMPLPKPGKDHSSIKGYRIITMQNIYGKILEKIVASRLARHLEVKKLLPDGLGSYRPGKDTCINTSVLAYDVYEGFQNKEETVIAAIDLEDAYNRVDYNKLMDMLLLEMEVDPWMTRWIATALFERKVALKCGRWVSDPVSIAPGLPQGSALSPVLFNIYTSSIARIGEGHSGRTLTFADDVTVYEKGKDRLAAGKALQNRLDGVAKWCDEHNAVINPSKAQVMWCSLNNRIVKDPTPPIIFYFCLIDRQEELKYLGITFDRTLSYRKHVDNVIQKAQKGIRAVKTMASAGIQQYVLLLLMQLVVMSVVDYGLGLLTLSKTQTERLERVQNAAMRAVLGCTRDTHVICMRYLLGLSSMKVRHKVAQAKMYLKVMGDPTHPLHSSLEVKKGGRVKRGSSWMAEAEESLKQVCDIDEIYVGKEWVELSHKDTSLTKVLITMGRERRECATSINDMDIRQLIEENSDPSDPIIYTDGSVKRGEKSGWGFVAYLNNSRVHGDSGAIDRTTSSMRMEIEAISRALQWLKAAMPRIKHVVVVTDSQSTLKRVGKRFVRREWIDAVNGTEIRAITWIFCPGHAGINGNEEADRMAGNAVIDGGVKLDKLEAIKALERRLREEDESGSVEHHAIVRMHTLGITRGEGKDKKLTGNDRRLFNQTATGTVSLYTLRRMLLRGTEHLWTCPECNDVVDQDK